MAPSYSGSLQTKNKTELKAIAGALRLSLDGTKDELSGRIKRHLDNNQPKLEDNPMFAGLYGRRRRGSEKPPSQVVERPALPPSRLAPEREPSPPPRKSAPVMRNKHLANVMPMDPIVETPVKDLRIISAMLKQPDPATPLQANGRQQPQQPTPSSLPPLPPSPSEGTGPSISAMVLSKPRDMVKKMMQADVKPPNESVKAFRGFLSNSRNIWSLTAVMELLYILAITTHWQGVLVSDKFKVAYPSAVDDWSILLHWSIPSLFIPAIVGTLISFSPVKSEGDRMDFDPLTASIVRLAAEAVYPYERFPLQSTSTLLGVHDVDVLGLRWRTVAAGVGVAFAFAEAITGAPKAIARELKHNPSSVSPPTSGRKMLTASGEEEEEEEDDEGAPSEEVD